MADGPDAPRTAVAQRATGRCEYCLIDEQDTGLPHHIDHLAIERILTPINDQLQDFKNWFHHARRLGAAPR